MEFSERFVNAYRAIHHDALGVVVDLDDGQLRWRRARSNSIAFNLWHMARWADHLASVVPEMTADLKARVGETRQIWAADALWRAWGFPEALGGVETGMDMDEDASATLPLPAKTELVRYVERAFAASERALGAVRDADLVRPARIPLALVPWLKGPEGLGTVGTWMIASFRHESRHLGMIEATKGAQGLRGTATR